MHAVVMKRNEGAVRERVREARQNALRAMRDAGFDVGDAVHVAVDPKLQFMGYTRPEGDGFQIVVSGMAVESGMLEGLLIHEMSHVYRMETKHPSHDGRVISGVIDGLGEQALSEEYRRKILHDLVNHIQDLYADDVSLAVMKDRGYVSRDRLSAFFQDWVKDAPVRSDHGTRDAWVNASILVNNARALAQMDRHRIEDIGGKAARGNGKFLSNVPPAASRHFEPFRTLLANLKAELTEAEYRKLLTGYLGRFLKLVEAFSAGPGSAPGKDTVESILGREIEEWSSEPPMHGGD